MTRTRLANDIFLLRFDTQYELASTFLRIQEHYESSRFRKRVFSLEDYMDWYAAEYGAFTYFEDWSGFNVPSTALAPFYRGEFDPLLKKEARLLALFSAGAPAVLRDWHIRAESDRHNRGDAGGGSPHSWAPGGRVSSCACSPTPARPSGLLLRHPILRWWC